MIGLGGPPEAVARQPFDGLVVFGDSLSDTGNVGRFTDGAVWVEIVARHLGLPLEPSGAGGTNYAVGGARSHGNGTDIRGQLWRYLDGRAGRTADPEALYVIWGGANDLLAAGCAPGRGAAATAAAAIAATVDDLLAAGARHLLVADLPDLGFAPLVRLQGDACAAEASRLTAEFNEELETGLREVEARRGVRVIRLDVFELAEEVLADPVAAGVPESGGESGGVSGGACPGAGCDAALFADPLHPSARAHAIIAGAALRALATRD